MHPHRPHHRLVLACALCLFSAGRLIAQTNTLAAELEPLRPFLGTWKGSFKSSTPDKPIVDVACWERALNGNAIRSSHSINDGLYGGETILFWDKKQNALVYYYFSTAGFMTTGTAKIENGKLVTLEKVEGDAGGVTQVRGTTNLPVDDRFKIVTEYFKEGEWVPGRETTYTRAPDARVLFK